MSVYQEFKKGDILSTVILAQPLTILASGTSGWRGNIGTSGAMSLYEGVRGRTDTGYGSQSGIVIYPIIATDTISPDGIIFISGSYPATGSVQLVTVRTVPIPQTVGSAFTLITDTDWYDEHWAPIELLFDYYSRFNDSCFTGSFDFYDMYFAEEQPQKAYCVYYSGSYLPTVTSSFTMEAAIKPTQLSGAFHADFDIMGQNGKWKFYVTGTNGCLAFTDFQLFVTASVPLTVGVWQHVAVSVASGSASFYTDGTLISQAPWTHMLTGSSTFDTSFTIGAELQATGTQVITEQGFSGMIYETKVWSQARTQAALSASWYTTLINSSSAQLVHYSRFNDGPLGTAHGYLIGSGVFDYSQTAIHGQFRNVRVVEPTSPIWEPNDDVTFYAPRTKILGSAGVFRVLHVPSLYYGRQIATGSFMMACNAYDGQGLVRVIRDDGRGNLYISGSITRAISGEDYTGVRWNKVGNIFYTEGIAVITDPSLLDFATPFGDQASDDTGEFPISFPYFFSTGVPPDQLGVNDLLQVSFRGDSRVPVKIFNCRMPPSMMNASNNPTYATAEPVKNPNGITYQRYEVNNPPPITYVSSIGIYNESRDLVAVAKLAGPMRKREADRLNIRLRMDL
jgi:hypothetical protein